VIEPDLAQLIVERREPDRAAAGRAADDAELFERAQLGRGELDARGQLDHRRSDRSGRDGDRIEQRALRRRQRVDQLVPQRGGLVAPGPQRAMPAQDAREDRRAARGDRELAARVGGDIGRGRANQRLELAGIERTERDVDLLDAHRAAARRGTQRRQPGRVVEPVRVHDHRIRHAGDRREHLGGVVVHPVQVVDPHHERPRGRRAHQQLAQRRDAEQAQPAIVVGQRARHRRHAPRQGRKQPDQRYQRARRDPGDRDLAVAHALGEAIDHAVDPAERDLLVGMTAPAQHQRVGAHRRDLVEEPADQHGLADPRRTVDPSDHGGRRIDPRERRGQLGERTGAANEREIERPMRRRMRCRGQLGERRRRVARRRPHLGLTRHQPAREREQCIVARRLARRLVVVVRRPGQRLDDHRADGVQIARRRDGAAAAALRRHVAGRARDLLVERRLADAGPDRRRQPEVGEQRAAAAIDEDVGRLDVEVDPARAVQRVERRGYPGERGRQPPPRIAVAGLPDPVEEVDRVDQLHREERLLGRHDEVE
jgi:hypothetical protein